MSCNEQDKGNQGLRDERETGGWKMGNMEGALYQKAAKQMSGTAASETSSSSIAIFSSIHIFIRMWLYFSLSFSNGVSFIHFLTSLRRKPIFFFLLSCEQC